MESTTIILLIGAVVGACGLLVVLARARRRLSLPLPAESLNNEPSVSVCIPARNEAHALSACLDRVLASQYEKLEILVLDDESSDATPTLIKSFAHAGVRFIAGKPLPNGWIGKNHALDTLAREASGDYIIFADVDVHLSTTAITDIVAVAASGSYSLLSFIPARADTQRASSLFGHMRYLWDIVVVGLGRQSASASLWCVNRRWLLSEGIDGFERASLAIRPELAFTTIAQHSQKLLLGRKFGITYEKRWHSQVESSLRLLLPSVRFYGVRGIAMAVSMVAASCLLFILLVIAFLSPTDTHLISVALVYIMGYSVHYAYLSMTWTSRAWLGAVVWPWAILQESILLLASMIQYTTHSVTWKGRRLDAQPDNDDYYTI